jgi:carbon monoxide dehydrogenase subunit G
MIKLEITVDVSRPPDEVFKFLTTDFTQNYPLMNPSVVRIEQVEGDGVHAGAVYRLDKMETLSSTTISIPIAEKDKSVEIRHNPDIGKTYSKAFVKIVEYVPNRKFTFIESSEAPRIDLKVSTLVEKARDGTQVNWLFEIKLPWWLRLVEPISRKMAQKNLEGFKDHLKQILESQERGLD